LNTRVPIAVPRPTVLIAEPEPPEALSTRKLVIETGKFNVLTAHSSEETLELIELFPKLDAVVFVEALAKAACPAMVAKIRKKKANAPIIILSPRIGYACKGANRVLSSHDPQALLGVLRELFGDPRVLADPK